MTSSACVVSSTQTTWSARIAAPSTNFTRGGDVSAEDQKCRMPALAIETVAARPETSRAPKSHQADGAGADGVKSAVMSTTFATKPESGGKPATITAQAMNAKP